MEGFDRTDLANPDYALADVLATAWEPPPPVDIVRWAEDHVVFGEDESFPGPMNFERFPWAVDILRALQPDDPCRVVVFKKSAQLGGTVLAMIFALALMTLAPSGLLYTHPTVDNALRWVRTKFKPMLRLMPAVAALFPPEGAKEGGNSLLYKERRDGRGWMVFGGAGSEASLSMISPRYQIQDDLSKWPINEAGDSEAQADTRSKAQRYAKIFKIGTPLIAGSCRISANYESSSQGRVHVPCPHCGFYHELTWENLRSTTPEGSPEKAAFTCPSCAERIEERHKMPILGRGQWVHRNLKLPARGFFLWTAYSPLTSWGDIVANFERAKGKPLSERVVWNDDLGREYEAQGDAPPWADLHQRAMDMGLPRGVVPAGGLKLAIGCDCQDNRVEWALWAGLSGCRRYLVDTGVIPHHIREPEARAELNALLARKWPRAVGAPRAADILAIDANVYTDDVLAWVWSKPASKVIAVRGVGQDVAPVLSLVKGPEKRRHTGKPRKYGNRFFNVGTSAIKFGLYADMRKEDPLQVGYVGFVDGLGEDTYKQITVEYREPQRHRDGTIRHLWVKPSGAPNEALDMAVYATAGLVRVRWDTLPPEGWAQLAEEIEPAAAPAAQLDLEDLVAAAATAAPKASPNRGAASIADRLA